MRMLYVMICLMCSIKAFCVDEIRPLISPLEVWQVKVPQKDIDNYDLTLSFFGHSYYGKDVEAKKFTGYENIDSLLTGFEAISWIGNPKIAKDCHFPFVNVRNLEGVKYKNGIIRISGTMTNPIYSGSHLLLGGVYTIEIRNIKDDEGDFTLTEMFWINSNGQSKSEKIGPLKIHKIK